MSENKLKGITPSAPSITLPFTKATGQLRKESGPISTVSARPTLAALLLQTYQIQFWSCGKAHGVRILGPNHDELGAAVENQSQRPPPIDAHVQEDASRAARRRIEGA